jgi:predicted TIM-barrel fold metal-dependent hydrolase
MLNPTENLLTGRGTSRRDLLKTLAAAGTAALIGSETSSAQTKYNAIDVHQHYQAPFTGAEGGRWTPEMALEIMDQNDIMTTIVSGGNYGGLVYGGDEKSRTMARRMNDYAAKICSDHPKRFGFFAVIPFPDTDASLKEIEYSFDTLKADGFGLLSSIGDTWPGDKKFWPVFEELNRRKAVGFLHPYVPKCCRTLIENGEASVERDFDTTRAVTNMLYQGQLAAMPDVRYIINHSGAAVPAMAGRIKDRMPGAASYPAKPQTDGITPKSPKGVFYELQKLYYEIAHAAYEAPLEALMHFAPRSQYLFGTDFPAEHPRNEQIELRKRNLPPDLLKTIYRENAERLFPRWKGVTA